MLASGEYVVAHSFVLEAQLRFGPKPPTPVLRCKPLVPTSANICDLNDELVAARLLSVATNSVYSFTNCWVSSIDARGTATNLRKKFNSFLASGQNFQSTGTGRGGGLLRAIPQQSVPQLCG